MGSHSKVHDLVQRAMRRPRTVLPNPGPLITDRDRACVRFSLEWDADVLVRVRYQSSTCAALLAYCEAVCDFLPGNSREALASFSAADLRLLLPEIAAARHARADLIVRAIQSAIPVSIQ